MESTRHSQVPKFHHYSSAWPSAGSCQKSITPSNFQYVRFHRNSQPADTLVLRCSTSTAHKCMSSAIWSILAAGDDDEFGDGRRKAGECETKSINGILIYIVKCVLNNCLNWYHSSMEYVFWCMVYSLAKRSVQNWRGELWCCSCCLYQTAACSLRGWKLGAIETAFRRMMLMLAVAKVVA